MTTVITVIILIAFYFTPTIAAVRRDRQPMPVFLLNLFLGWTVVGWIAAAMIALWRNENHAHAR